MDLWLSVIDYAVIKKVSVSTLRRRIKSQILETKFQNGKYLIRVSNSENANFDNIESIEIEKKNANNENSEFLLNNRTSVEGLIQELKNAYSQVLSEKEEMISQLRSEIEILKHMNHFLERQIMSSTSEIDSQIPEQDLI